MPLGLASTEGLGRTLALADHAKLTTLLGYLSLCVLELPDGGYITEEHG